MSGPQVHQSTVVLGTLSGPSSASVGAHCVIRGNVVLGENVRIGDGCIVGSAGEHRSLRSDMSKPLLIGAGTTITDKVVIQRGLEPDKNVPEDELVLYDNTRIGDGCYIMDGAHIAHDCQLGHGVVVAPKVTLGGHTILMAKSYMGIASCTHQHTVVGPLAMVGMGAMVTRNVRPFSRVVGMPAKPKGVNTVGLDRAGLSEEQLESMASDYRELCEIFPARLRRTPLPA